MQPNPKTRPGMPITPQLMLVSVAAGPVVTLVEVASVPERDEDSKGDKVQFHAYP
jgi:hypothetical protein